MKAIYISTRRSVHRETFLVPEGHYRGVVSKVDTGVRNGEEEIVIRFQLDWSENGVPGVARTCISTKGLDHLVNTLEGWLGSEELDRLSENGQMDLQKLVGREADLCIVERDPRPPYKERLRTIEGILPPGRLISRSVASQIGDCEI